MFTLKDLHFVRDHELQLLAGYLPPGGSILELGAGTGEQALALSRAGFQVKAVDLARSRYRQRRVFPVVDYDGTHLPFEDAEFDAVFSSNVLEHVRDLPAVLCETQRVLRPAGYAVHAMPSPTWRLWTTLSGPLDVAPFLASKLSRTPSDQLTTGGTLKGVVERFAPLAHGARGNAFSELVTFGADHWRRLFHLNGFDVERAEPMRLFYTGRCLFGRLLSLEARERLSQSLGSSCWVYVVRPR